PGTRLVASEAKATMRLLAEIEPLLSPSPWMPPVPMLARGRAAGKRPVSWRRWWWPRERRILPVSAPALSFSGPATGPSLAGYYAPIAHGQQAPAGQRAGQSDEGALSLAPDPIPAVTPRLDRGVQGNRLRCLLS